MYTCTGSHIIMIHVCEIKVTKANVRISELFFKLFCVSLSCRSMACAMGSIRAVADALQIHIDRNQVGSIRPSINLKHNVNKER